MSQVLQRSSSAYEHRGEGDGQARAKTSLFVRRRGCPNSDLCEGSSPRLSSSPIRKMSLPGYTQIPTEDCGASSTISPDDEESEQTRAADPPASSAKPHPSSAQFALPPYLAMFVLVGRLMIYSEKKAISYRSRNRLVRVPSLPLLAALLYTCHPSIAIGLSLTLHH
jgi:hypothetical protein